MTSPTPHEQELRLSEQMLLHEIGALDPLERIKAFHRLTLHYRELAKRAYTLRQAATHDCYQLGYTQRELAAEIGVTPSVLHKGIKVDFVNGGGGKMEAS
jgi:hypothetical protein